MQRRTVLRAAAAAVLGSGCVRSPLDRPAPAADRYRPALARVRVAEDRIIRTVVGLRPYRTSGFRVEAERLGSQLVVHNYGHGGAGVTLSWGSADFAAGFVSQSEGKAVAVLGCGVVGLSTARLLQDRGFAVTIYASDVPPNTTSNVAGAQWAPYTVVDEAFRTAAFARTLRRAAEFSHRYFQDLVGSEYGVYWRSNYVTGDRPPGFPWEIEQVRGLFAEVRDLRSGEHPFPTRYARHFVTMHIEPAPYLRALLRDFFVRGGHVVRRTFRDWREVAVLDEPVVVNCTGLGARQLCGDEAVLPVKGQLTVLLPQPEVDYIVIGGGGYMMPRTDGIVLGGTHERGVETMEPNYEAARRIVEAHKRFFAAMDE